MAHMNDQHLARFESQLERLVEGTFAAVFGKRIRAQDIALQVARAMEDRAEREAGEGRRLAPDDYTIRMHGRAQQQLMQHQPNLTSLLSQHIVELATNTGYKLNSTPLVTLIADNALDAGKVVVTASHSHRQNNSTAVMKPVMLPADGESHTPKNPQLLIGGRVNFPLEKVMVTIGRGRANDVIVDDPFVSRHHAQLRLRFGGYTLFDSNSTAGTFVNGVQILEHRLQPGDVIQIGNTQMLYLEDERASDPHHLGQTDLLQPIPPSEAE